MKLLHLTFHFEYEEQVEVIFDDHSIENYVRFSMMDGKDRDGKHFGSQVYPGNSTVIQAQVQEESVDQLMNDLKKLKESRETLQHLEALILPIENRLA